MTLQFLELDQWAILQFCALFCAERQVFSIDHWPIRLQKTKDLGAEIINFDDEDPVEKIKKETGGRGVICIDAVRYEAVGHIGTIGNGEMEMRLV